MTKKRLRYRSYFCALLVFAVFCLYAMRLVDWQIVNGNAILERANRSNICLVKNEAIRGEILDLNGVQMVQNTTGYKVVFDRFAIDRDKENEIILSLVDLMKIKGEKFIDELPIIINKENQFEFLLDRDKEIEELKSRNRLNVNSYATAQDCMDKLTEMFDAHQYNNAGRRDLASVRYNMLRRGYYQSLATQYTFAEDISPEMVTIISERYQKIKGIRIAISTIRKAVNTDLMPHIIGTYGAMSQELYSKYKEKGYAMDSYIGKSGVELVAEEYLRGAGGERAVEISKEGNVLNVSQKSDARPGNTVYLTIDSRIQQVANKSIERHIKIAKNASSSTGKGHDCESGAVVVLDVKDFSVLACATYPSYDSARYLSDVEYYKDVMQNKTRPLFNRATNGAFAPGSIYKPLVACAAMQEGRFTEETKIHCGGKYQYPGTSFYTNCLGVHGNANFYSAMAHSCNVYFSELGRLLGIESLNAYAKRFGLGVKTGIEVPESAGVLAGPEYSKSIGEVWSDRVTIKASIGQSDNMFTPIQLATYMATIANGGKRYRTHFIRKITDYKRENIVFENNPDVPELVETSGVSEDNINKVKKSMREVVLRGTAASLSSYGVTVAAKTGTAQNSGSDHTTFVCFAPFDDPKIAIAVIVEHGVLGRVSSGVARDIMDAYFLNKYFGEPAAEKARPETTALSRQNDTEA